MSLMIQKNFTDHHVETATLGQYRPYVAIYWMHMGGFYVRISIRSSMKV